MSLYDNYLKESRKTDGCFYGGLFLFLFFTFLAIFCACYYG